MNNEHLIKVSIPAGHEPASDHMRPVKEGEKYLGRDGNVRIAMSDRTDDYIIIRKIEPKAYSDGTHDHRQHKAEIEYDICRICSGAGMLYDGVEDGVGLPCTTCDGRGHMTPDTQLWRDVTIQDRCHPKPDCAEVKSKDIGWDTASPNGHWGGRDEYRVPAGWKPATTPKPSRQDVGDVKVSGASPPHLRPERTESSQRRRHGEQQAPMIEMYALRIIVMLGIKPQIDGNQWAFLWGDDLQTGVAGFGNTVMDAANDFYHNLNSAVPTKKTKK